MQNFFYITSKIIPTPSSMVSYLIVWLHSRNQPSVPKSLLRVLKNLEDQSGCVAQLFIAYVDPQTGTTSCQK
jgi:hypothetical protein